MGMSIVNNTAELQNLLAQVMALPNENEHLEDLNAANGVSMTSMQNAINETQVMADDQALLINELSQTLTGRAIGGNVSSYDLEISAVWSSSIRFEDGEFSIISGDAGEVWSRVFYEKQPVSVRVCYEYDYSGETLHSYSDACHVAAILTNASVGLLEINSIMNNAGLLEHHVFWIAADGITSVDRRTINVTG